MKAFETPSLRTALTTTKDKLFESEQNLNTMRTKCNYLENQIVTRENYFASHELALKEAHDRELKKGKYTNDIQFSKSEFSINKFCFFSHFHFRLGSGFR